MFGSRTLELARMRIGRPRELWERANARKGRSMMTKSHVKGSKFAMEIISCVAEFLPCCRRYLFTRYGFGLRGFLTGLEGVLSMRIAQVAPLTEAIPPKLYGGTERVVSWLTEEMIQLGHDVTLFASGDSRTSGKLEAPSPPALRLD